MAFFAVWVAFGIAAAIVQSQKGSGCFGFLLVLLLGPIGLVIAIVSKGNRVQCPSCRELIDPAASRCPHCQKETTGGPVPVAETKKCPACAELIKAEAVKCRFCGHQYDAESVGADVAERKAAFERKLRQGGLVTQEGLSGDAFCFGCRTTGPRSEMLFNESQDVFYHVGCLPK